jgi:ATP-dependent helicase/nuclease subunit A
MGGMLTVASAAAGTGKTTRLVCEYLGLLKQGLSPREIVAITFTRKAAAELVERVSSCLRAAAGDPRVSADFLNEYKACFEGVGPTDPVFIEKCQRELLNAPVGTTDSFVLSLLGEFALEAGLPVGDGRTALLDVPVGTGDSTAAFDAAAREVIDPLGGTVPPEAARLLRRLRFKEVLAQVGVLARDLPSDPVACSTEVIAVLLRALADAVRATWPDVATLPALTGVDYAKNLPEIQAWLSAGGMDPAPACLAVWCNAFLSSGAMPVAEAQAAFLAHVADLGAVRLSLKDVAAVLAANAPESCVQSDEIRADLHALASRVRDRAWELAVEGGLLDHDLLTEAATHLCTRPDRSDRLKNRFRAILVDEAQDSSPRQYRLYRAIEDLPGNGERLAAFYVGDSRQSIYLFRGAEPREFDALRARAGKHEDLHTNFRSTPELVAAQRALFGTVLADGDGLPPLPGLDPVDQVTADPNRAIADPEDEEGMAPIIIVAQKVDEGKKPSWDSEMANAAAIDQFTERLKAAWAVSGRDGETAAVLTASWAKALKARNRLRAILGADRAFLDGGGQIRSGTVARDLRTLVRALWDRTNDLAWTGVWRHPMVGLTDGALAQLKEGLVVQVRHGKGKEATWEAYHGLAPAAGMELVLPGILSPLDAMVMERTRPTLRQAAGDIGRVPTADVIEDVAAALWWRPILLAGPGGEDAAAELEVCLDWIRQAESGGVDPEAVLALLDPDGEGEEPRLELRRGKGTVSCTTVHQAKGLKYHHVMVYDIGTSPRGGALDDWTRATIEIDGRPQVLLGVRFDPNGGLDPKNDLFQTLSSKVSAVRRNAERLRMAYVAVTRAVRTVTFSLVPPRNNPGIMKLLGSKWLQPAVEKRLEGVRVEFCKELLNVKPLQTGHAVALGPFPVAPVKAKGWTLVSPSSARAFWGEVELDELVRRIASSPDFREGDLQLGAPALEESEGQDLEKVEETRWGDLVHSWLQSGGLEADVPVERCSAWLEREYALEDQELADWLIRLSRSLEVQQPDIVRAIRSQGARILFEFPFIGVGGSESDRLHAGRMDLVVAWPDRRACWIIDFKAGRHGPTIKEKAKSGHLKTYGPQIEAYRQSLTRAGWTVERAGLWYVRQGTWLGW